MKPTALLLALWPLALAAPVPEPKDTHSEFTYRLTLFSSTSCGHTTADSSPSASLTVILGGTNNHFTKPLPSTPKSVRVQGLSASCNLALETSSGARIAVNAAGGCTKLPANSGGDEGFVRVTADCDS